MNITKPAVHVYDFVILQASHLGTSSLNPFNEWMSHEILQILEPQNKMNPPSYLITNSENTDVN